MDAIEIQNLMHEVQRLRLINRQKDEILSELGHEMRDALSTIVGLAESIKSGDVDSKEITRAASVIERNGSNTLQIVNNMMELRQFDDTRYHLDLDVETFDVETFLRSVAEDYGLFAKKKGIDLKLFPPEEPLSITADRVKLWQVMGNLVSNALKFTRTGGTVRLIAIPAELDPKGNPQAITFKVQDNGIGIPKEFMPQIYKKFGIHHRPGTAREEGIGIGLSVVKKLVTLHKGDIDIISHTNRGTTFVVTLPLSVDREKEPQADVV